jgi:integrase
MIYFIITQKGGKIMRKQRDYITTYQMRNGKKYWTVRAVLGTDVNGKPHRKSFSGFKKSEVEEKMEDYLSKIKNMDTEEYSAYQEETLGSFLKYWLFNIKKYEIQSTSLARYDQILRLRILPHRISTIKIVDLRTIDIQKYINNLVLNTGCTENMAKDTLGLLKVFFKYCVIIGIMPNNIAQYVQVPKLEKIENKKIFRVFSAEEQNKIVAELDTSDVVEQMLYINFFSGLRRGELRGLQVKNYKDGSLTVTHQLRRKYNYDEYGNKTMIKNKVMELKTESSARTIPLPKVAVKMMDKIIVEAAQKYFRLGKQFTDTSFIFVDDMCNPIEEKRLNRRLQSICEKLEIKKQPLHAIRHSYATRLFEYGVDVKTVQELMGHYDYQTTLDIYIHVMPQARENAVSNFDKYFIANK